MNAPNPFKQTHDRESDLLCYGKEDKASVRALFSAVFGDAGEGEVAIPALEQLSVELTVLSAYFEGDATLNDEILKSMLHNMAERARAAAEVQRRINSANAMGGGS